MTRRLAILVFVFVTGGCRHGTPEKMSIKAARTSRFSEPWGGASTKAPPEPASAPPTQP